MSATPKTLPQCTRTTVMDHLFRREYQLTYVETIIMSYLVLAPSWAKNVNGFSLIRTSKMIDDLMVGEKTIEATITKLKKLELIEVKLAIYHPWSPTQKFRTVKITLKGQKYNLSYHKPEVYQYTTSLEEVLEEYRAKNAFIQLEKNKIKQENIELEIKLKASNDFLENSDKMTEEALKVLKNDEALKAKIEALEKSLEEARTIIKEKELQEKEIKKENNNTQEVEIQKEINSDVFKRKIIKNFSSSAKVICNGVEGWDYDVKFFINTYNRLSIKLLSGELKQLTDIDDITKFWEWLFKNQGRVGKITTKPIDPHLLELMAFEGKTFLTKSHKVTKIEASHHGVIISLKNLENEKEGFIQDAKGNKTLSIERAISTLKYYVFGNN